MSIGLFKINWMYAIPNESKWILLVNCYDIDTK